MKINPHSSHYLKQQNRLFTVLFLIFMGLLAFLSTRYVYLSDWTLNHQNSLNNMSLTLLKKMLEPIEITSYTNNKKTQQAIRTLIKRYQNNKPDIHLKFVDPDQDPEKTRALNISIEGEMLIRYEGRQENVTQLSEQDISNTLYRLLRANKRRLFFIQGHGERHPNQDANFDLSQLSRHLSKQGFLIDTINLAKEKSIPDEVAILVIAGPRLAFLPFELKLIINYIDAGGHLLWLADPLKVSSNHPMHGLLPLAKHLGIEFIDGVVVDPSTEQYDIERPDYAIITQYPQHPINEGFSSITLFPQAAGIERLPTFLRNNKLNVPQSSPSLQAFNISAFLMTIEQSWIETSPLKEHLHFSDLLDVMGPITIGMALNRPLTFATEQSTTEQSKTEQSIKEQRIVIIGDGDFLSNTFIGNAGNLTLGLNIFNWLSHDEQFMNIPTRIKDDIILDLSPIQLSLLGSFFLVFIPSLLLLIGSLIWFKRRKH